MVSLQDDSKQALKNCVEYKVLTGTCICKCTCTFVWVMLDLSLRKLTLPLNTMCIFPPLLAFGNKDFVYEGEETWSAFHFISG